MNPCTVTTTHSLELSFGSRKTQRSARSDAASWSTVGPSAWSDARAGAGADTTAAAPIQAAVARVIVRSARAPVAAIAFPMACSFLQFEFRATTIAIWKRSDRWEEVRPEV